jgi:hypothetical protein
MGCCLVFAFFCFGQNESQKCPESFIYLVDSNEQDGTEAKHSWSLWLGFQISCFFASLLSYL